MTLDIARSEHREALKWACELTSENRTIMSDRARHGWALSEPTYSRESAALALSYPSDSAAIVRALLEGCGVRVDMIASDAIRVFRNFGDTTVCFANAIVQKRTPALVLALLACTTREEALAALKEHGR